MAGGKIFQTKTVDPTDPSIGGKVYQVTQVDPTDPHTQGMVYQVVNVGGGSATIEELNVTPSTSAQTIEATSSIDGYAPVNVAAVTSSIDANIVAGNIKKDITILGVTGSYEAGGGGTIEALNVTPSTSAQTITATGGVDGYSPVNVSAVTSSIDANITAGNIKKDVTILGVTGSYEGGTTPTGTLQITTNGVHDVTNYASADVAVPTSGPSMYVKYAVNNGVLERDGTNTPLISLSGVTEVEQFALFRAFKDNTSISGSVDLTNINVIRPSAFREAFVGCTGITGNVTVALDGSLYINPDVRDGFGNYFYHAFDGAGVTSVTITGSDFVQSTSNKFGYAFARMFENCSSLTTLNATNLTGSIKLAMTYSGAPFGSMFKNSGLTSVDLSNLTNVAGRELFTETFSNCLNLTTVVLGLTSIGPSSGSTYATNATFNKTFYGCTALVNVDVSKLEKLEGTQTSSSGATLKSMFAGCTALRKISFDSLSEIPHRYCFSYTFGGCQNLHIYFPSFNPTTFGSYVNALDNMLYNATDEIPSLDCTVHFPSNMQSVIGSWSSVTSGFGGTNTTVLWDLPATVTLTGADSNTYKRNPKYDTANSLGWYNTSTGRATPYYTSGTTDPAVSDTIYSDSACTTPVTTISSIA